MVHGRQLLQTEVAAQRVAAVVAAEQATLAQNGHDLAGKQFQLLVDDGRHDVKTIGSAGGEPVFNGVSHLLGRARNRQVAACTRQTLEQLAQCESIAQRGFHIANGTALGGFDQMGSRGSHHG